MAVPPGLLHPPADLSAEPSLEGPGRLRSWAAQLEWWDPDEGRWVWVARYDTAGGRAHRDRNRIARHEPVDLPEDPGKAAKVAEVELARRAEEYIEAYRAARAWGREAW